MRKLILLTILSLVITAASANQSSSELFLEDLPVIDKDPNELFALAVKYEHAEGFPEDKTKAAELYCEAARLGLADAQFALGWMYANGRGVERDDSIAAQLFEMAAEQGHHYAQKMIQYTPAILPVPLPACLIPSIEIFDE
jgi:TPR repeat protein